MLGVTTKKRASFEAQCRSRAAKQRQVLNAKQATISKSGYSAHKNHLRHINNRVLCSKEKRLRFT